MGSTIRAVMPRLSLQSLLTACLVLWVSVTSAQTIQATNNASLFDANTMLELAIQPSKSSMTSTVKVAPLTTDAGMGATNSELSNVYIQGELFLTTTSSVSSLTTTQIAYISCDDGDYNKTFLSLAGVFQTATTKQPEAVIFYSTVDEFCSYTPGGVSFSLIYTMTASNASMEVLGILNATSSNSATVAQDTASNTSSSNSSVLGPSPTTAVAMIILYSITGLITALFLCIIVTGAVRAHRHPERYGPRNIAGRPRQSRARGIARAMLETLPIVKFGDHEDIKPGEIELGNAGSAPNSSEGTGSAATSSLANEPRAENTERASGEATRDGIGAAMPPHTSSSNASGEDINREEQHAHNEQGLGCAICTEEFEKGEDVRVLPCNHKYHPACIDPWLLNVSGTCPLCRVDLRPTATNTSETAGDTENPENLPPPLTEGEAEAATGTPADAAEAEGSNSRSRRHLLNPLHVIRLRSLDSPEARIAALRNMRRERQANGIDAADSEGRRGRIRTFFSEVAAMSRGPPGNTPENGYDMEGNLPGNR